MLLSIFFLAKGDFFYLSLLGTYHANITLLVLWDNVILHH